MVYGDRRPHLVGLLVPAADAALAWAKEHGKPTDLETLVADPDFRKFISEAIDRVNRDLSQIEKVRRFALIADAFTVNNEMATPTLKIRRHAILAKYGKMLHDLYEDKRG